MCSCKSDRLLLPITKGPVKILCILQRCLVRTAEVWGIQNVQGEVILTEKKVKVTKDLGVAAGNIEVVISRSRAEGGRGWEMGVWRWQQGEILSK